MFKTPKKRRDDLATTPQVQLSSPKIPKRGCHQKVVTPPKPKQTPNHKKKSKTQSQRTRNSLSVKINPKRKQRPPQTKTQTVFRLPLGQGNCGVNMDPTLAKTPLRREYAN